MSDEDLFQCRVSAQDSMAVEINDYYNATRIALVMHHTEGETEISVISVHLDRDDALRLLQSIHNLLPKLGYHNAKAV